MITKRFYELKHGDVFTYMGTRREVTRVENGFIYHGIRHRTGFSHIEATGWHSKEIVEYHFNKNDRTGL